MKNNEQYNAYMREYKRRNYKKIRDLAIAELGGKCAKCGSPENLELDHIDPTTKEIEVGAIHSVSRVRFWAEIKKCQLLCRSCHVKKTLADKGQKPAKGTHGTLSSYRYCHCDACKAGKAAHHRKYMENRLR